MKIIFQQRNKLKNTAILFYIDKDNFNNQLYYRYLIDKKYKGDYTCIIKDGIEVENIFHLVVKGQKDSYLDNIKEFIKDTTHTKLFLILDDLVTLNKSKLAYSYPDELPKKGYYFDFYNKQIVDLKIGQRKSVLKNYQVFKNNYCFINIGKKESKSRLKLIDKIQDYTTIQDFILIKKNIAQFDNIKSETLSDIDNIYKTLKRKKMNVQKELINIKDVSTLPIDVYGIRLSTTKSYTIINERIKKYLSISASMNLVKPCACKKKPCICSKKLPKTNPTLKTMNNCPCGSKFADCGCSKKLSMKNCPCGSKFADCGCSKPKSTSKTMKNCPCGSKFADCGCSKPKPSKTMKNCPCGSKFADCGCSRSK